jgi:hypothetical protein
MAGRGWHLAIDYGTPRCTAAGAPGWPTWPSSGRRRRSRGAAADGLPGLRPRRARGPTGPRTAHAPPRARAHRFARARRAALGVRAGRAAQTASHVIRAVSASGFLPRLSVRPAAAKWAARRSHGGSRCRRSRRALSARSGASQLRWGIPARGRPSSVQRRQGDEARWGVVLPFPLLAGVPEGLPEPRETSEVSEGSPARGLRCGEDLLSVAYLPPAQRLWP